MARSVHRARLDIPAELARGLNGIKETPVTLDELLRARADSIAGVIGNMPADHRHFLPQTRRTRLGFAARARYGSAAGSSLASGESRAPGCCNACSAASRG